MTNTRKIIGRRCVTVGYDLTPVGPYNSVMKQSIDCKQESQNRLPVDLCDFRGHDLCYAFGYA